MNRKDVILAGEAVLATTALVVVLIVALGISGYFVEKAQCKAKTQSFASHKFGLFVGCMVELKEDVWIPLENVRVDVR